MTNGQKTNVTKLERTGETGFQLTHDGELFSFMVPTGDMDDAIAWVACFLQIDHIWVQHVTDQNLMIAIGVEE